MQQFPEFIFQGIERGLGRLRKRGDPVGFDCERAVFEYRKMPRRKTVNAFEDRPGRGNDVEVEVIEDGLLIDLGREQTKSPISQRIDRFVEIYKPYIMKRDLRPRRVDLRYLNGFVLQIR